MKGDLQTQIEKNGKKFIRKLNPDRIYNDIDGSKFKLHGQSIIIK